MSEKCVLRFAMVMLLAAHNASAAPLSIHEDQAGRFVIGPRVTPPPPKPFQKHVRLGNTHISKHLMASLAAATPSSKPICLGGLQREDIHETLAICMEQGQLDPHERKALHGLLTRNDVVYAEITTPVRLSDVAKKTLVDAVIQLSDHDGLESVAIAPCDDCIPRAVISAHPDK